MSDPILVDDKMLSELYHIRLVVLMETQPFSNKYRQVAFTHQQFLAFSRFLASQGEAREGGHIETRINAEHIIQLPDSIQDHYDANPVT